MKSKLLMSALAAGVAACALTVAAPASATVFFSFTPGAGSPEAGYTVINDFSSAAGISGVNFQIKTPPSDSDGAVPGNEAPPGTSYLSVLAGGTASISFGPVTAFEFDWGSIDSYNTLTIHTNLGDGVVIPGGNFPNAADGNQFAAGTNGLFKVWSDAGETFSGITLASSTNSFEIDNLAVPGGVPEPASWALMISGFGMAGSLLRAKRRKLALA